MGIGFKQQRIGGGAAAVLQHQRRWQQHAAAASAEVAAAWQGAAAGWGWLPGNNPARGGLAAWREERWAQRDWFI